MGEIKINNNKRIVVFVLFVLASILVLSIFASIPYIFTICGISVWVALGHLLTLDDDLPGEWGNLDGAKKVWQQSVGELGIKILVMLVVLSLAVCIPELREYGG